MYISFNLLETNQSKVEEGKKNKQTHSNSVKHKTMRFYYLDSKDLKKKEAFYYTESENFCLNER